MLKTREAICMGMRLWGQNGNVWDVKADIVNGVLFFKKVVYDMLAPIISLSMGLMNMYEGRISEEKAKLKRGHSMCIEMGTQVVVLIIDTS